MIVTLREPLFEDGKALCSPSLVPLALDVKFKFRRFELLQTRKLAAVSYMSSVLDTATNKKTPSTCFYSSFNTLTFGSAIFKFN